MIRWFAVSRLRGFDDAPRGTSSHRGRAPSVIRRRSEGSRRFGSPTTVRVPEAFRRRDSRRDRGGGGPHRIGGRRRERPRGGGGEGGGGRGGGGGGGVVRRRGRNTVGDDRLVVAVGLHEDEMDDLGRDLSDALERAERESRRNRFLSDLGARSSSTSSSTVCSTPCSRSQASTPPWSPSRNQRPPTIARRGTDARRGGTPSVGGFVRYPPGPITVTYRYGPSDAANTDLIRGGLFLWFIGRESHALGTLSLFWRTPGFDPPQERIDALEEIAAACVPAIENARRYREARQARRDRCSDRVLQPASLPRHAPPRGAPGPSYGRRLALLILDLDDFKASTTASGTLRATPCWRRSPSGSAIRSGRSTSAAGSAATSSR